MADIKEVKAHPELYEQLLSAAMKKSIKQTINDALPAQTDSEFPDGFTCGLCKKLVHDPLMCMHCDEILYCRECVSQIGVLKKCVKCKKEAPNNAAPGNNDLLTGCNRLLMKMLNELPVRCSRCHVEGDSRVMNYVQLQKHAQTCQKFKCPLNCGCQEVFKSKEEAMKHYEVCQKALVACERCNKGYNKIDIKTHACISLQVQNQQKILEDNYVTLQNLKVDNEFFSKELVDLKQYSGNKDDEIEKLQLKLEKLRQRNQDNHKIIADSKFGHIYEEQCQKGAECFRRFNIQMIKIKTKQIDSQILNQIAEFTKNGQTIPKTPINQKSVLKNSDYKDQNVMNSVKQLMVDTGLLMAFAKNLHFKYNIKDGSRDKPEFQEAVKAIQFIQEIKKIQQSKLAYNALVRAGWDPLLAVQS